MFGLGPATKILVAVGTVDMRKGFEGLYGRIQEHLGQDPLSSHLYLFANRDKTRLKALTWDGTGLWVCAKRLERGRFHWPKATPEAQCVTMRPEELAMLLSGLDLAGAQLRKNWFRQVSFKQFCAELGSPHRNAGTGTQLGHAEDSGSGTTASSGTHPPHGSAQRRAERSATGTAASGTNGDAGRRPRYACKPQPIVTSIFIAQLIRGIRNHDGAVPQSEGLHSVEPLPAG